MRSRKEKTILRIVALALSLFTVANSAFSVYAHYGVQGRILYEASDVEAAAMLLDDAGGSEDGSGGETEDGSGGETEDGSGGETEDGSGDETNGGSGDETNGGSGDETNAETGEVTNDGTGEKTAGETGDEQSKAKSATVPTPTPTPTATATPTPTPTPELAEEEKGKDPITGEVTCDENGIQGVGLESLKISLNTEKLFEEDSFKVTITTEADLSAEGGALSKEGSDYVISGLSKDSGSVTLSGLEKKDFTISAQAEGESKIKFEYNASPVAEGSFSVDASITATSEKEIEEKETDHFETDVLPGGMSKAGISLVGGKLPETTRLVIGSGTADESKFKEAVESEDVSALGIYLFDIHLEDEEGSEVNLPAGVSAQVTLTFAPSLFDELSDVERYVIQHEKDGTVYNIKVVDASETGLSVITFGVASFSPFAVTAIKGETGEEKEPVTYDMKDWISNIKLYVKDESGEFSEVTKETVLKADDYVKVTMDYRIPTETVTLTAKDTLEYQIPDFLYRLKEVTTGRVMDNKNPAGIGDYSITPNENGGVLKISFDESYVEKTSGSINGGSISFEGCLNAEKIGGGKGSTKLIFGDVEFEIFFDPESGADAGNLILEKKETGYDAEKEAFTYVIRVEAPDTNTIPMTEVKVQDTFDKGKGVITYVKDSIQAPEGTEVTIDENGNSFTWKIGEMKPGTVLELEYQAKLGTDFDSSKVTVIKNTAVLTSKELKDPIEKTVEVNNEISINLTKGILKQKGTGYFANTDMDYNMEDHTVIYRLEVANTNKSWPANNVKVKDAFFEKDANAHILGKDVIESYEYFKLVDKDGTATGEDADVTTGTGTFTWNVGTLAPGESRILEYKVRLVDHSDSSELQDDVWYQSDSVNPSQYDQTNYLKNKAELYVAEKKIKDTTAEVKFRKIWVYKTGSFSAGKIRFEVHANETNSQTKAPTKNVGGWVFHDELLTENVQYTGDLIVKVADYGPIGAPLTEYDKIPIESLLNSDGRSFTYTIPDEIGNKYIALIYYAESTVGTYGSSTFSNKIGIGPGPGSLIASHSASASGKTVIGVTKRFVKHDNEYAEWESKIQTTITQGESIYTDYVTGPHYFDRSTMDLKVYGPDKALMTEGVDYNFTLNDDNTTFTLTFNKNMQGNAGSPITLTYRTKLLANDMEIGKRYEFRNYAKIKNSIGEDSANAVFGYTKYADIEKRYSSYDQENGTLTWNLIVNKGGMMEGDAIIEDILPDGLAIESVSIVRRGSSAGNVKLTSAPEKGATGRVRITLSGLKYCNNIEGYVDIKIVTKITDEGFLLGRYNSAEKAKTFENKALLLDKDGRELAESSASAKIWYRAMDKSGLYKDAKATYTINVNPAGVDMLQNKDTITIVDEMDEKLVLNPDTIQVKDSAGNPVEYQKIILGSNKFNLVVPDNKALIITYDAYVKGQIGEKVTVKNSCYFYGEESTPGKEEEVISLIVQKSAVTAYSNSIDLKKIDTAGTPLVGAVFDIYRADAAGNMKLWKAGQKTGNISGYEGVLTISGVEAGVLYAYKEVKAPDGYILDDTMHYFWIAEEDGSTKKPAGAEGKADDPLNFGDIVPVVNRKLSLRVRKTDGSNLLDGAVFTLTNEDGSIVSKGNTGEGGIFTFPDLSADTVYYLTEDIAPKGFDKLDAPYKIEIDDKGRISAYAGERQADGTVVYNRVSVTTDDQTGEILLNVVNRPETTPTPSATPTATATGTPTPTASGTPTPEASTTPSATPTNTPGNTPGTTPENTPGTTPENTPGTTPGNTPGTTPGNPPEGEVLGASRVPEGGAVLGARRGSDYAVLGKRRRPGTGDSLAMVAWLIALAAAAGCSFLSILAMKHNRKKKR